MIDDHGEIRVLFDEGGVRFLLVHGVVGVEHRFDVRVIDLFHNSYGIGETIADVALGGGNGLHEESKIARGSFRRELRETFCEAVVAAWDGAPAARAAARAWLDGAPSAFPS